MVGSGSLAAGSPGAVRGAGPEPAPSLPGPGRAGHRRGLRAQGRGRVRALVTH